MNPFNNNSNNGNFYSQVNQLMNNPMVQVLKSQGMNTEQIVRYICQQRGINVDEFLKQIRAGNNK